MLKEVYYIPSLCSNIINLGQLAEDGYQTVILGSFLWVHDYTGSLLMKLERSPNRLYKISLNELKGKCLVGKVDEPTWLWHKRLGQY